MFRHILVAWDGSDAATYAFTIAADLASKYHAALTILSVISASADVETSDERNEAVERAKQRLSERAHALHRIAYEYDVKADFVTETADHAADAIVDYAHEHGFDLIVMGRRGVSLARIERFLLGSTSDKVMRYVHCPVLIVSPAN
jgi:nucleotide-binding universal stress UspA family protein